MLNSFKMRRRAFLSLTVATLCLAAGCENKTTESPTATASTGSVATNATTTTKLTIAVIPKGLTHVFWQAVKSGAEKAGTEFGVEIKWVGAQKESDPNGQTGIVENMIL
jgi:ribose transport system substrate-binding protein